MARGLGGVGTGLLVGGALGLGLGYSMAQNQQKKKTTRRKTTTRKTTTKRKTADKWLDF